MKLCCMFIELVVLINLIEESELKSSPELYIEAYNLNSYNERYRFYTTNKPTVQRSLRGKFRIHGERYRLPVVATRKVLFTKDSIPYWFQVKTIAVYHYVVGSPIKLSTLYNNGSTIVQYLGDKLDPLCTHLNCQLELTVGLNNWHKREVAYPTKWSMIILILAPFPRGVNRAGQRKPDSNLQCRFDE